MITLQSNQSQKKITKVSINSLPVLDIAKRSNNSLQAMLSTGGWEPIEAINKIEAVNARSRNLKLCPE